MKRSRFQILMVFGLLALLGVLAALQYIWLGQISDAEKDRMTRRLQTDTERFGEDFNREIQSAYFNFQSDEELWQKKDWARFNERYDFWSGKAAYPNLIGEFYYFENNENPQLLRYDSEKREFIETDWTDNLQSLRKKAQTEENFQPLDEENFALVMPVHEAAKSFDRIIIRKSSPETPNGADVVSNAPIKLDLPKKTGFLIIKLDQTVVKAQILPDLAKKDFPEGDFNLAVVGKDSQTIYQTNAVNAPEKSIEFFDLAPDNLLFFANRDILPRTQNEKGVIVNRQVQGDSVSTVRTQTFTVNASQEKKELKIELPNGEKQRTILDTNNQPQKGIWTLNVQHSAGSLDKFIANTRNKNLGISFGILGLLALSIILIFVSAQRAKILAQRQIDFVSSVSHEFRTPLGGDLFGGRKPCRRYRAGRRAGFALRKFNQRRGQKTFQDGRTNSRLCGSKFRQEEI